MSYILSYECFHLRDVSIVMYVYPRAYYIRQNQLLGLPSKIATLEIYNHNDSCVVGTDSLILCDHSHSVSV